MTFPLEGSRVTFIDKDFYCIDFIHFIPFYRNNASKLSFTV